MTQDLVAILRSSRTFEQLPDLRVAHYTDVVVRINGQDRRFEADWVKLLQAAIRDSSEAGPAPGEAE